MYLIAMTLGILIVPNIITYLLGNNLKLKPKFVISRWLIAAAILQFSISVIYSYNYNQYMNFVMHAVGGGVASSLMFQHVKRQLGWRFTALQEFMFVFAFVSAFGVLNEIAEATLDFIGFGMFSLDRFDTWLDLIANSTGGFVGLALIKALGLDSRRRI